MSLSRLASENARIVADMIAERPGWDQESADKMVEEIQLEAIRNSMGGVKVQMVSPQKLSKPIAVPKPGSKKKGRPSKDEES